MNKPHKYAGVIKAWADGALIEMQREDGTWALILDPMFQSRGAYRVHDPLREFKEAYERGEQVEGYVSGSWRICGLTPKWEEIAARGVPLRIAPKPDRKFSGYAYVQGHRIQMEVTFDGATNQPKSAELVK